MVFGLIRACDFMSVESSTAIQKLTQNHARLGLNVGWLSAVDKVDILGR